ncbi:FAD-dependent monooxygenase [candidate division WOR-3 bacterium]|nr:FAD-dependent monooxygenase [candidate division WOR-3 bacterium]
MPATASDTADILVVGAGTAGCAAAANLPPGARALLIDRSDPAAGRCCGGLVARDACRALDRLGLVPPPGVRVDPEPRDVHALDLESGREQVYRRDYWNVDRARFDGWLLGRARERVEFRARTRLVAATRVPGGFDCTLRGDGREFHVRAGTIIGADGARSRVRSLLFGDRPRPRTIAALQAWLPPCPLLDRHEVVFSPRFGDFYAWAIPKPGGVLVGSAFADPRATADRFAAAVRHFADLLGLPAVTLGRCARPLSRPARAAELLPGGRGALLVGEAAGLVSPSSGEGISFALESGAAAARALGAPSPDAHYRRSFAALARAVRRKLPKARIIFTPGLRRLALRLPWYP